eukprot:s635_g6.t2
MEARNRRRDAKLKVEREMVRPEQARDIEQQLLSPEMISLDPQLRPEKFRAQVISHLAGEEPGRERRVWVRSSTEEPQVMEDILGQLCENLWKNWENPENQPVTWHLFIAMDDLSINISGIAPAAARTAAAVSKISGSKPSKVKSSSVARGKAKTVRPQQPQQPRALEASGNYASKVKDWRKNRFQKDREPNFSSGPGGKEFKASKKRKNAAPKAVLVESSQKRKAPDDPDVSPKASKKKRTGGSTKGRAEQLQEGTGVISEMKFQSLKLHESLRRQLEYLNFTDCTPIQSLAVPQALTGKRDVMLRAPTGSGKTLAFLLPVVHQLLTVPGGVDRRKGTLATVLSPTKELALQTLKVATDLCRMVPALVCGAVAGGEKPKSEKARLRKGLVLLCATPGRLSYHLEHTATFIVRNIKCLVLDEADRLLDMGFEPQMRSIHKKLLEAAKEGENGEGTLQTMLVSATLVPAVRELAEFCLRPKAFWADADAAAAAAEENAGTVSLGQELNFAAPSTLTQWYCIVPGKERLAMLLAAILSRVGKKKSIIFFSTGASVDFHCDLLQDATWPPRAGIRKKNDQGPTLKKVGKFIGLAKDAKKFGLQEDDEIDDDENDEDDEEENKKKEDLDAGVKMFTKTQILKLHGSLSKEERAGYIADFLKVPGGVLLASDAASRGLDFPRIDWIIQYDPPQRTEEYLHRVGRTARIGKSGSALLFLQPSELGFLDVLRGRGLTDLREMPMEEMLVMWICEAPPDLQNLRNLQALLSGHLASRVSAQTLLASRARSAFLSSLKALPKWENVGVDAGKLQKFLGTWKDVEEKDYLLVGTIC